MNWLVQIIIFASCLVTASAVACDAGNPCQNGGNCGAGSCTCLPGFTGDLCETEIDFDFTADASYAEDQGTVTMTVSRISLNYILTLSVATAGTADSSDYTLSTTSLILGVNEGSKDLTLSIVNDILPETDETIIITISHTDGTSKSRTYTIEKNDGPVVYTSFPTTVNEGSSGFNFASTNFLFIGITQVPIPITVTITGVTAVQSSDYTVSEASGSLTFTYNPLIPATRAPLDALTVTFPDDNIPEAPKTLTVVISSDYHLGGDLTKTITINDFDAVVVSSNLPQTVEEGDSFNFAASAFTFTSGENAPVTLTVTVASGTATVGTDFTVSEASNTLTFLYNPSDLTSRSAFDALTVSVPEDNTVETDKTFTVTFSSDVNLVGAQPQTITIIDNDPEVITLTGPSTVDEDQGTATYTLTRTTTIRAVTLTAFVRAAAIDTALYNTNVEEDSFNIAFAVGETSKTFTVTLNDDQEIQIPKSFTVSAGGDLVAAITDLVVTITEDDEYEVTYSGTTVVEGANVVVQFTRDSSVGNLDISVSTADGTATAGSDFTGQTASTVTFADGATTTTLTFPTTQDGTHEPTESFTVTMTSTANLKASSTASATFTITDNDDEVLTLTGGGNVNENAGTVTITITRTTSFAPLTVGASTVIPGGATHPITSADITMQTGASLTLPTGTLSQDFVVAITNDANPEADETFDVIVTGPSPIATQTTTVTIVNDDPYVVTFSDASVVEGNSVSLTFTRTVSAGALATTLTATDITATGGVDYPTQTIPVNFADGSATTTASVTTTHDTQHEPTETFMVALTSSQPLSPVSATITITDNDVEVLSVSGGGNVNENAGAVTFTVTRTASFAALTVTASTSIPGSATFPIQANDIVQQTNAQLNFGVGELSKDFVVTINDDALTEQDEVFGVTFTAPGSIAPVTAQATITNDDPYGVDFSGSSQTEGSAFTVVFTRDSTVGALSIAVTTADDSAVSASDYTSLSQTLTFADGAATVSSTIQTTQDSAYENSETFTVSISSSSSLKPAALAPRTFTIDDDDVEVLTVTSTGTSVNEDSGPITFTITRTATFEVLPVTVSVGVGTGGNPAATADLVRQAVSSLSFPIGQATVTFEEGFVDDDILEADETYDITVSAGSPIADVVVSVTILNDDDYGVTYSNTAVDEGDTLSLDFTRDSTFGSLTIVVSTADGTAVSPSDYTSVTGSSLTFADGVDTMSIDITTIEDDLFENDDTFTVSITSTTTLKGSSTTSATMTISNEDAYGVTFGDMTVTEGETITVTFSRDSSVGALTIDVTTTDVSALGTSDYTAQTASFVTFADGASSVTHDIATTEDNVYEDTETFTVSITSTSPLKPASLSPATMTINDDDVEVLTITDITVQEDAGTATVTITRTASFEELIVEAATAIPSTTYPITVADIVPQPRAPLTFPIGTLSKDYVVSINDDDLYEHDEQFLVAIVAPGSIADVQGTVTIQNDDLYEVTYSDATETEGGTLSMTFTRDSNVGDLDIVVSTNDGTAVSSSDYTAQSAVTLSFADGSFTVTHDIPTTDDSIREATETFTVTMTTVPSLKPSSTSSATITINDDDVEVLTITGSSSVNENAGSVTLTISRTSTFDTLAVTASTEIPTAPYPITAADITMRTNVALNFPVGTQTVDFVVSIGDDAVAEADEVFKVTVDAPNPIVDVEYTVTITNDDPDVVTMPTFLGLYEDGVSKFITITRTVDDKEVTVQVNTNDATAVAGVDYMGLTNQDVTFGVGSLTATFMVSVINDLVDEADETFTLVVSGTTVVTTNPYIFFIVDNEGSRPFDCRRQGQTCSEPTDVCHPDLPICECIGGAPRQGDRCDVITGQINGAACTNDCNNNGVCLDNAGAQSCVCHPGYYGANCEHYFLNAVCSAENMILIANPLGTFTGKIYVKEFLDVSACTAIAVPNPAVPSDNIDDNLLGYYLEVDHESATCGTIAAQEGPVEISFIRKIIVQYKPDVTTGVDQIVTISCTVNKNNLLVNAGTITVDPNAPLTEEATSNTFPPLSMAVDSNNSPVIEGSEVAIAQKLCVTLRVPPTLGGLEIIHIDFNNNLDPPDLLTWRVFTSGCPESDVESVLVNNPFYPTTTKREMKFCFFAFKFVNSLTLKVEVTVKLCVNPNDCQVRSCTARRKRQADSTSETTLSTTFNIVESATSQLSTNQQNTNSDVTQVSTNDVCKLPMEFIPTVVCLGVLIFLLVLLCLFLTYRLFSRSKKYTDKEEPEPMPTRIVPQWLVFRR